MLPVTMVTSCLGRSKVPEVDNHTLSRVHGSHTGRPQNLRKEFCFNHTGIKCGLYKINKYKIYIYIYIYIYIDLVLYVCSPAGEV